MDKKIDIAHPKIVRGMKSVSKAVIIIPLVLFFLALIFHFYSEYQDAQRERLAAFRAEQLKREQDKQASLSALIRQDNPKYDINLTLDGNYVCNYVSTDATVSGIIQQGNVSFVVQGATESANMVVDGDCAYLWDSTNTGTKMCGLDQYRSLARLFSGVGVLDASSLISMFSGSLTTPVSTDEALIPKTLEQCQEATQSGQLQEIPSNVMFQESQVSNEAAQGTGENVDPSQLMQMFQNGGR